MSKKQKHSSPKQSLTERIENHLTRFDYLLEKQIKHQKQGKDLTSDEHRELKLLQPNVFVPITMLFEILYDTVKTNVSTYEEQKRHYQQGGSDDSDSVKKIDRKKRQEEEKALKVQESLLPLLTELIVYIEKNKKKIRKRYLGQCSRAISRYRNKYQKQCNFSCTQNQEIFR